jgi:hypothetical protein
MLTAYQLNTDDYHLHMAIFKLRLKSVTSYYGKSCITNMDFKSKNISLVILGITALLCSRISFYFFNDPEGPNLLIVVVLAIAIFFLSLAAYVFTPFKITGLQKLSAVVCVQILSVVGLYFCMK